MIALRRAMMGRQCAAPAGDAGRPGERRVRQGLLNLDVAQVKDVVDILHDALAYEQCAKLTDLPVRSAL